METKNLKPKCESSYNDSDHDKSFDKHFGNAVTTSGKLINSFTLGQNSFSEDDLLSKMKKALGGDEHGRI